MAEVSSMMDISPACVRRIAASIWRKWRDFFRHDSEFLKRARQGEESFAMALPALFTVPVQFEFNLNPRRDFADGQFVTVNGRQIRLVLVRNLRARKYWLRLRPDAAARVTVPRFGSVAEARRFVDRNKAWLERELLRLAARPRQPAEWRAGSEIFFRGERVRIDSVAGGEAGTVRCGSEIIPVPDPAADLRPLIERHLFRLAARELPGRLQELAAVHGFDVRRITIRNQRTRWGSCSRNGTISLNWRLIQTPPFVRDYICLHELAHLRQMNHSSSFWREVGRLCPDYQTAEHWLRQHSLLR